MKIAKLFGILLTAVFGIALIITLSTALLNWGNFSELNGDFFWAYDPMIQEVIIARVNLASISALMAIPCGILMMAGIMLARHK